MCASLDDRQRLFVSKFVSLLPDDAFFFLFREREREKKNARAIGKREREEREREDASNAREERGE